MALKMTQAADYAIRGMLYIASFPEGRAVLRAEVAEAEGIPHSFMAKILRSLVRAGLLRSTRGVRGGFVLARPAAEINMLQVLEAVEGPLSLAPCVPNPEECARSAACPAQGVWEAAQGSLSETLRQATLEALVSMPRRNGVVAFRPRTVAEANAG